MNLTFSSDRTGFPLIHLAELGFDVHLLPITKKQFEPFVQSMSVQSMSVQSTPVQSTPVQSTPGLNAFYEEAIALNPPAAEGVKKGSKIFLEPALMTGVLPEEALQFAVWLDNNDPTSEYALPNVEEWRAVYDYLQYERCEQTIGEVLANCRNEHALHIVQLILKKQPQTLLDLSLMRNGIIEWVHQEETWVGLGAPRPAFYPNTFDPLKETVEPINPAQRMRMFGFRLIRVF